MLTLSDRDTAIRVASVSKRYRLGRQGLRSLATSWRDALLRRDDHTEDQDYCWALRDVSFEVKRGEMLGIIGPNGAGKTTTLKLLSRITRPTSGRIITNGHLSALIELGAGLHPELTGRENVFLNGAILGLTRRDIAERLDEIIAFAGLERFIDTPVKQYSSGMYVRLGFAVAIHTDPQILLIDEVLSVGDMDFQTKCLNKIGRLRDAGLTIVFVSHTLHHVSGFCNRVAYLRDGRLRSIGEPRRVIGAYIDDVMSKQTNASLDNVTDMNQVYGSGRAVITDISFLDESGAAVGQINSGDPVTARVFYSSSDHIENPLLDVVIRDSASGNLFQATNRHYSTELGHLGQLGFIDVVFDRIDANNQLLNFFFTLWDSNHVEQFDWKRYIKLQVAGDPTSSGRTMFACHWRNTVVD